MSGYHQALVMVGVAALAIVIGYVFFGRKNKDAVRTDERINYTWRRLTAWMLPVYLGLSYVACLVALASNVHAISVFSLMTYLWVTMAVFGIAFAVVRRT